MKVVNNSPLGTNRKDAVIAAVLFIIGTVSGSISAMLYVPLMKAPDFLVKFAANQNLINLAIILQFVMGIACAGISVALYPIIKRYSQSMAIGSVGFRLMENTLQILQAVCMVTWLSLGRQMIGADPITATNLQSSAEIIRNISDWMIHGAALICFSIGAALYYVVFYQHRLIPRWISVWGLISLTFAVIASALVMLNIIPGFGSIQMIANLSIFAQEMVFAVWLIIKGVQHPTELISTSTQMVSN